MTMLVGQRLALREINEAEWPEIHAYSALPEVARYQPWGSNSVAETRAFVLHSIAAARSVPRTEYQLAATLVDGGGLIGTGALTVRSAEHGQGEIGYFLHPDAWGRGYATEIARLLVGFGFENLKLHRIFGTCDPRNVASARVLEKVGMTREGRLRDSMRIRDGWRDSDVYAILAHEWNECNAW